MSSKNHRKQVEYWRNRETKQRKKNIKKEAEYKKQIGDIYEYMFWNIQKEINAFYEKYAGENGISIADAKKKVSELDIKAYEKKAKKYVKSRDFSKEANEEMKLYNLTMKVNRLEMLKASIGLELVDGFEDMKEYYEQVLTDETLEEYKRQAGILGKTVQNNTEKAKNIVNASFYNATFSDRIWTYQNELKFELSKLLQQGLIQGKGSRELARLLRQKFDVSKSQAEALMTTELRRVQTSAAKDSYDKNGYEEYQFIATNPRGPCDECKKLEGRHFKVKDMMIGENAPPMHTRCHCTTAPWQDEKAFYEWLNSIED